MLYFKFAKLLQRPFPKTRLQAVRPPVYSKQKLQHKFPHRKQKRKISNKIYTLDHGWPESITARRSFPRKFFARCGHVQRTATNLVPAFLPPIGPPLTRVCQAQQLTLFMLSCHLLDPPSHEFAKRVKDDTYTALKQNSDYNASDSHDDSVQ